MTGRLRFGPLWLTAPALVFLLVLLLLPCLQLLSLSVQDPQTGSLSFAAYRRAFGATLYLRVLSSTFAIALQTTALCLGCGYPLAYWISRQEPARQRALSLLVLFAFWTSTLVKSFVWLVLLGHTGPLVILLTWLGVPAPELLFNRATVVLAMTHTLLPLAVVTMLPSINKVDPQVVRAAATLGASGAEAFWRVIFPLSLPGVAAAGLLVFIAALGFYITPALLGGPHDTMLGQVIIQQILSQQNWAFGGALAAMLVGSALLTGLLYDLLFGLSGIAGTPPNRAGNWTGRAGAELLQLIGSSTAALANRIGFINPRWALAIYGWVLMALLLLPILACVPMGFTSSTFLSFPPPGYSLRWFATYFSSLVWVGATLRSFAIGLASAGLTLLIAGPASYGLARSRSRLVRVAFLALIAPLIVPGVVMAVGLFTLFARIGLIATDAGIVLGHTISGIPLAVVILLAQWRQYDWRLDQAAVGLGAGRGLVFRRITAPLVKGGLLAAFIFAFLNSFEELTVALFIGGGMKVTLPRQMWDDINLQVTPTLAAASLVVLMVVTGLFLVGERLRPAGPR